MQQRSFLYATRWMACFFLAITMLEACGGNSTPTSIQPTLVVNKTATYDVQSIFKLEAGNQQFSGTVLLVEKGHVLIRRAYGLADAAHGIFNQPETKFRINRLSRQFTAMAILKLQQQGRLHIQDTLCSYLASCPSSWQAITIEQALELTAGIPNYTATSDYTQRSAILTTPTDYVARLQNLPLDFKPGTRIGMNSSAYIVLGAIIEKVTGDTYAHVLQRTVLDPLGLKHTGYDLNTQPVAERAVGSNGLTTGDAVDVSELYADQGLYSTIDDLYRWDQELINPPPADKLLVDELMPHKDYCKIFQCGTRFKPGSASLGFGLTSSLSTANRTVIGYRQSFGGFAVLNQIYPQEKVMFIALSNKEQGLDFLDANTVEQVLFPNSNN